MNEKMKADWIAELRSGKWKQIQCRLGTHGTNKRCANGVLCEVAGYELLEGGAFIGPSGFEAYASLSSDMERELDVTRSVPVWIDGDPSNEHSVIYLNDEKSFSFAEIADILESGYIPTRWEAWTGTRQSSPETGTERESGNAPSSVQSVP